jgi:hypothetical protein
MSLCQPNTGIETDKAIGGMPSEQIPNKNSNKLPNTRIVCTQGSGQPNRALGLFKIIANSVIPDQLYFSFVQEYERLQSCLSLM